MASGVLLALVAYAFYSCADATIKSFTGSLGVFEIGFFTTLFSLLPAIATKSRETSWRSLLHLRHPWLVQVRGAAGVLAAACVIFAFTHIPLAEVYSIGFLTPLFVVLLSALLLKEPIPTYRWPFLIISFLGVMLVVRPGFQALELGHFAIFCGAFLTALCTIVLRRVAPYENRLSIVGVVALYSLTVNGLAMVMSGFTLPTPDQMAMLALIGLLGGTAHLLFITATSMAPANQVAPTQYSQIAWGILFGAVFYHEYPDLVALLGLVIVAVAGILNVLSEEACVRVISRFGVAFGKGRKTGEACPPAVEASTPTEV